MERRGKLLHDVAMENITSFLPKIKIFESLPAEIIREIEQLVTRSNTYKLSKNSILQKPVDERDGLFFVIAGKLRLYKTNSAGKQHTVCILSEGGMFGEVETFSLGTRGI
ncbi:hypothetical protein BK138_35560 [Paenibacillus rhizosphaerae]|uniref:Cyclic nucleotide-binding domain-containing protein n=1 Tax=Paenibacillus rhizosphaerae TaxID=297318 RepID=A0A1R1DTV2_9BACL|nr:cyclic nucleotide-binding domain-containing protein [Paenibacillus rhizosphaerae]OMF42948.1 hypothetical protein BK138_35560 [Paenibacillus rhizosphaerae]